MLTFILLLFSFKIYLLETIDTIQIKVYNTYQDKIGKRGTIVFYSYIYKYDDIYLEIDTSKKPIFKTEILDSSNKSYIIDCGPWTEEKTNFKLYIFCNLDETIPHGEFSIEFNSTINYQGYNFNVLSVEKHKITKLDKDIIDLYSDIQTINVTDNKDIYELKFNINSYNNEIIFIGTYDQIIDCFEENNDLLICTISKEKLERFMIESEPNLKIYALHNDNNNKFESFYLVPPIKVYFNNIKNKENVYIKITKLLTKEKPPYDGIIAYETNVTNISNVFSRFFYMTFTSGEIEKELSCGFVKGNILPLIMFCLARSDIRTLYLKEIKNEIPINSLNNKYNFNIQPVNNNEIFKIGDSTSSIIYSIYPEVLNFTQKDTFIIRFFIYFPSIYTGITFNENSKDLKCEDFHSTSIKKCIIEKSHFKGKESGFYYTKFTNRNTNKKVIAYESIPIQVILPIENSSNNDNSSNIILISIIISICALILIGIIICIYIKKRKNTTDLKEEIINDSLKEL